MASVVGTKLWNPTDGNLGKINLWTTNAGYARPGKTLKPALASSAVGLTFANETTTGIFCFDEVSVKRVGLVGHWKFQGDYSDETSDYNTLTAGGSGSAFPGYNLEKFRIISLFSTN